MKQLIEEMRQTGWHNPTKGVVKVRLFVGVGRNAFQEVTWQPDETKHLPSAYDHAIQKVDKRTKRVVGGKAPMLRRLGDEQRELDPAIDPAFAEKTASDQALQEAVAQRVAADIAVSAAAERATEVNQATSAAPKKTVAKADPKKSDGAK